MEPFRYETYKRKVEAAMVTCKKVLDVNRNPKLASPEQAHNYTDKFSLAESLTNTAIAAELNALSTIGLDEQKLATLCEWAKKKTVTIRFSSTETCVFVKKEVKDVESPSKHVTESSGFGGLLRTTHKVVTTVTSYHWTVGAEWEIAAYAGSDVDTKIVLMGSKGTAPRTTSTETQPRPAVKKRVGSGLKLPKQLLTISLACDICR
jgi:hypothetical protein